MSGFPADWLALREPADGAARSRPVLATCRAYFAGRDRITVCDLGAGTGAAIPAFGPYLPPRQRWFLVDNDPATLAAAERQRARPGVTIETIAADLAVDPTPWPAGCDLVTATALFDLAGAEWIEALCRRLAAQQLPLLATLTYDGEQVFAPAHAADAEMVVAFNRHQRLDKGLGGPASGPEGSAILAAGLAAHGYHMRTGASPWRLQGTRDAALIAELLRGWASAVTADGFVERSVAEQWLSARLHRTDTMWVGHRDMFAAPHRIGARRED